MPKREPKKKPAPVQPVASIPPPTPESISVVVAVPPDLTVVYDKLEIIEYSTTSATGPLTITDMKLLMGWETEKEFQTRKVAENPGTKPEAWIFGDVYHCKNVAGQKVRCNNNAQNRPFDEPWCAALVETVLRGQWAGPFTVPGETVNGETIRVSRYGRVISGQHQMSAGILAGEWLAKARADGTDHPDAPKYPVWRKHGEPFIESIVITGMSEDPRILMTVDYVRPRTVADMLYTSPMFKESTAPERKDLCKMMASGADTLWTRTDARGYRTHPEVAAFLDRHKSLLKCVTHLFAENSTGGGRKVSKLHLNAGDCAAIMFLQATSGPGTDGDVYRNEEPPTEKNLDWSLWDKAEEFWTLLAGGKDFQLVRAVLGLLAGSSPTNSNNQGLGGNWPEKLAIVEKAWERWKGHTGGGAVFDAADLEKGGGLDLSYSDLDDKGNNLPEGQIKLIDTADFYGIDCPESIGKGPTSKGPPDPPAPTTEEIERLTQEAIARRQAGAKK